MQSNEGERGVRGFHVITSLPRELSKFTFQYAKKYIMQPRSRDGSNPSLPQAVVRKNSPPSIHRVGQSAISSGYSFMFLKSYRHAPSSGRG
jgi:hypothetical protein